MALTEARLLHFMFSSIGVDHAASKHGGSEGLLRAVASIA
jgi:hypothetical protein